MKKKLTFSFLELILIIFFSYELIGLLVFAIVELPKKLLMSFVATSFLSFAFGDFSPWNCFFNLSFSHSANVKHFSNTTESIKLIPEIALPYVKRERRYLDSESQPALLIIDVFRGLMTQPVLDLLKENDILPVQVLVNMTQIFQPLDLTVSRSAKSFVKQKLTEWYYNKIKLQLEAETKLDGIEVKLTLTTLKPLHST